MTNDADLTACTRKDICRSYLFSVLPARCLFDTVDRRPAIRRRPTGQLSRPWFELNFKMIQFAPWDDLINQLAPPPVLDRASLKNRLINAASRFSSRVCEAALNASRADSRAGNLKIAELADSFIGALNQLSDEDRPIFDRLPSPPRPTHIGSNWTLEVVSYLKALEEEGLISRQPLPQRLRTASRKLRVQLIGMDRNSSNHLWPWAIDQEGRQDTPVSRNDPLAPVENMLELLRRSASEAAEADRDRKSGGSNVALHMAVEEVDAAVFSARGTHLRHNSGRSGEYTGRASYPDDVFIVLFFKMIFVSIPPCIKAQHPMFFQAEASLDSLKELIEARNAREKRAGEQVG